MKKNQADLGKDLREKQEALRAWRFALSGAKVKNVKEGKVMRKDIARIQTALSALKAKAE
ncbi:MAG: 50S ribosomal protein L29 [Candidatus Paceibacterota bacterium]